MHSANLKSLLESLASCGRLLWEKGWVEGSGGNISLNVTEIAGREISTEKPSATLSLNTPYPGLAGQILLITGTGKRLRDLAVRPEEVLSLLRIGDKGSHAHLFSLTGAEPARPTSEIDAHLQVQHLFLENDSGKKALLHTHPNALIALTHIPSFTKKELLNDLLQRMHPEVKIFIPEGAALVPYLPPGSESLARATREALRQHRVVLWEKHGCLATGGDVQEAFDLIDILDKAARIYFHCRSAGSKPQGLSDKQLEELPVL
jgi:rhamnulose-1-phosphate aldolase